MTQLRLIVTKFSSQDWQETNEVQTSDNEYHVTLRFNSFSAKTVVTKFKHWNR